MTAPDYADLRRLAEAAKPGPWQVNCPPDYYCMILSADGTHVCGELDRREHTLYLQAVDPTTILALLDERDRMAAENDRLREAVVDLACSKESVGWCPGCIVGKALGRPECGGGA